ncbi:hypothetical protein BY996DRAFT_6461307 [Phakopsora pachyrhizi]|nr:hypothetical protein BY996DRAFT_6461307 [Phakopsora pachyrhizi]
MDEITRTLTNVLKSGPFDLGASIESGNYINVAHNAGENRAGAAPWFNQYPLAMDPCGQATTFLMDEFKDRKMLPLVGAQRVLYVLDVEHLSPIFNAVLNKELPRWWNKLQSLSKSTRNIYAKEADILMKEVDEAPDNQLSHPLTTSEHQERLFTAYLAKAIFVIPRITRSYRSKPGSPSHAVPARVKINQWRQSQYYRYRYASYLSGRRSIEPALLRAATCKRRTICSSAARLLSMTADTIDLLRTERGKGLSNMHSGLLRRLSVNLSTKKQQLLPGGGNSSTAAIQGVPPPDVGAGQRTPKKDSPGYNHNLHSSNAREVNNAETVQEINRVVCKPSNTRLVSNKDQQTKKLFGTTQNINSINGVARQVKSYPVSPS